MIKRRNLTIVLAGVAVLITFYLLNDHDNDYDHDHRVDYNEPISKYMLPKSYMTKTLVLYAYFEKNDFYVKTLKFFIEIGVEESEYVDYLFIIQGGNTTVNLPNYKNVKRYDRPNDCFDFGAYGASIEWLGGIDNLRNYTHFLFINPSTIGPLLPKYWPSNLHWTYVFISKLKGNVHATGTSLVCLPYPDNLGGTGPRLEGMAFALTYRALKTVVMTKSIFICHQDKFAAIIKGEYGLTIALLKNGMNIDTLLAKYGSLDWLDKKNWGCNGHAHPSRINSYLTPTGFRMTIHPLETVFYKPQWWENGILLSEQYLNETVAYMDWALARRRFVV